ncbi:MAG: hypothetical protein H8E14_08465 [Candidatus Marinimicrobia bacterium]|nr:hypothetical protein [Candidatus Neomarinimicrobiota bacterium]
MNTLITTFIMTLTLMLSMSCSEHDLTDPKVDLVMVEIHLQSGFEGYLVLMEFNGDEYFRSELSESVPFAGPLATFSTLLPRGQNHFYTFWGQAGNQVWNEDSVDIQFDNAEKYFLGVNVYADTLNVVVQDSTFLYL